MKTLIPNLLLIFCISKGLAQQAEDISVGAGYGKQAYYSLATGEIFQLNNEDWDISFSNIGNQDAGVFINESVKSMGTSLKLFLAPTTNWDDKILSTVEFVDSVQLYNPEKNWTEGAFNSIKSSSPFDFGWGKYSPTTNTVDGDKIFVLKQRDGSFKKLQIISLASKKYTFRIANLDGSNEVINEVTKDSNAQPNILFSLRDNKIVNIPIAYDLIFQRYVTPLADGSGKEIPYTVTGVLLGPKVSAVKADSVDVTTVKEADYASKYTELPTVIGHDWKNFNFQTGWSIVNNRIYFVKTKTGQKYSIEFLDFQGSSTGITTINKVLLQTSSTSNSEDKISIDIYPNPVSDYLKTNYKNEINAMIYDVSGKLIIQQLFNRENNIDISHLKNGYYILKGNTKKGKTFTNTFIK